MSGYMSIFVCMAFPSCMVYRPRRGNGEKRPQSGKALCEVYHNMIHRIPSSDPVVGRSHFKLSSTFRRATLTGTREALPQYMKVLRTCELRHIGVLGSHSHRKSASNFPNAIALASVGNTQMLLAGVQNLPILPPKSGDFGLRIPQLFSAPPVMAFSRKLDR